MNKSVPSLFGKLTSSLFDEYPIYKCQIPSELINTYLPDALHPFPRISLTNVLKRDFFYSKPILFASSVQISRNYEELPNSMKLEDLLKELLSKTTDLIRYNFVISGKDLILVRVAPLHHASYRLHCKHITLSNHSNDIRFAGEFWCDGHSIFRFNNNSGTYRPSDLLIEKTVELFHELTPYLQFEGISFRLNCRPSLKNRLLFKIKDRTEK